jgi:hypothetical protein
VAELTCCGDSANRRFNGLSLSAVYCQWRSRRPRWNTFFLGSPTNIYRGCWALGLLAYA